MGQNRALRARSCGFSIFFILFFSCGEIFASSALTPSSCGVELSKLTDIFENSGVFKPESQWPEGLGKIATPEEVPLTVQSAALAYGMGIFWWRLPGTTNFGWFSESERAIIKTKDLKVERDIERALQDLIREGGIITMNTAFSETIEKCSIRPRAKDIPWLTPELKTVFKELNRLGYAHSIEIWGPVEEETKKRVLLASVYGIYINGHFGGESVYTNRNAGSHFGKLVVLASILHNARLRTGEIDPESWVDVQTTETDTEVVSYKVKMGAKTISRKEFNDLLKNSDSEISFVPGMVAGEPQPARETPYQMDLHQLLSDVQAIRAKNSQDARDEETARNKKSPEELAAKAADKERKRLDWIARGSPKGPKN